MKKTNSYYIYGIHPVLSLLKNTPNRIIKIEASQKLASKHNLANAQILSHQEFTKKYPNINHQSLVALVKEKEFSDLEDLISSKEEDKILILDRITDVGNCGAIIRSSVAFGVKKIILPRHDSMKDLSIIAKASAGFSEICEFAEVVNLSKSLNLLKEHGYWCVGLDGDAKDSVASIKKFNKIALILGNEGKGIKDLVKKHCDLLVRIETNPEVQSLNVAASAAIALSHLWEQ